ncbi:MAG: type III pantothenate kinase, partial [Planctomycetota bacterium]
MDGVQPPDLLAIAVGNTRTRCGVFIAGQLEASATAPNAHAGEIEDAIAAATGKHAETLALAAVSSVAHAHLETAIAAMRRVVPALEPQIAGRDIPLPIPLALEDPGTVGVDRLLNTTAAYETAKQACVVVDVGTAATVDFVDGQGVFQGGAIAPGLAMMLAALHEHTAALP